MNYLNVGASFVVLWGASILVHLSKNIGNIISTVYYIITGSNNDTTMSNFFNYSIPQIIITFVLYFHDVNFENVESVEAE
jgi:hypothetical protein